MTVVFLQATCDWRSYLHINMHMFTEYTWTFLLQFFLTAKGIIKSKVKDAENVGGPQKGQWGCPIA